MIIEKDKHMKLIELNQWKKNIILYKITYIRNIIQK
jgi:hypothetical protein